MYEMIVAMNVTNAESYARYRAAMTPLLEAAGGGFRFDFVVSDTLSALPAHPVTRVFAIYFRDQAASDAFFADPAYLAVKAEHYTHAVDGFTVMAAGARPDA